MAIWTDLLRQSLNFSIIHLVKPAIRKIHDYFENFHGTKLVFLFVSIFAASLVIGLLIGQIPALFDRKPVEPVYVPRGQGKKVDDVIEKSGKVVYLDPSKYPNDNISYKLVDREGKDVVLLTASDDKLKLVEGAFVTLRGKTQVLSDGKTQAFFVQQIIYK